MKEKIKIVWSFLNLFFFKKVEIVSIEEGDVIVLSSEEELPDIATERLSLRLKEIFPRNQCIILEEGLKLKVLRNVAV